jgi:Holliday junction resolvase
MIKNNTKREIKKIRELVREYEKKGFTVTVEPSGYTLPDFMRELNYIPDLIAISQEESHVVEVSSRDSAERLREISKIVDTIEKERGWRFILVMTNPRVPTVEAIQPAVPELSDLQSAYNRLLKLEELSHNYKNEFDHAILLSAWSIVEGALRMYNYTGKSKTPVRSSRSVVRDAVMIGFITQKEGEFLDYIAGIRNPLAHGAVNSKISAASLNKLVKLCKSLVSEVKK